MITCMLVDDNKMARLALRQIISQVKELQILHECENAVEAYNILQHELVDLLFLDIEMPGISGLELADKMKSKDTYIIYTTGKAAYAVDAFKLNVIDYLIKPISLNRFLQAIDKLKESIQQHKNTNVINNDYFFVKDKGALKKVSLHDILFFEAMGDYVKVVSTDKSYMIHSTLKQIEVKISTHTFFRVHRSYIISLQKIDRIEDGVVSMQQYNIPVADSYRAALNARIQLL